MANRAWCLLLNVYYALAFTYLIKNRACSKYQHWYWLRKRNNFDHIHYFMSMWVLLGKCFVDWMALANPKRKIVLDMHLYVHLTTNQVISVPSMYKWNVYEWIKENLMCMFMMFRFHYMIFIGFSNACVCEAYNFSRFTTFFTFKQLSEAFRKYWTISINLGVKTTQISLVTLNYTLRNIF